MKKHIAFLHLSGLVCFAVRDSSIDNFLSMYVRAVSCQSTQLVPVN